MIVRRIVLTFCFAVLCLAPLVGCAPPVDSYSDSVHITAPPSTTAPLNTLHTEVLHEEGGAAAKTGTSGKAHLHLVKAQPVIWGAFGFMPTADATLTMENGEFARAVPKEAGEVIVYQFFRTEWEGVSGQPYWAHTFDAAGNSTRAPLLVVSTDNLVLFGPCRTEAGVVPPGPPVVGVADIQVFNPSGTEVAVAEAPESRFYTFDRATPSGENPLKPVGGTFQLPDIPVSDSAPWK